MDFSSLKITPENLARVVEMLKNDEISSTNAQEVVKILLNEGGNPDTIVDTKGLRQVNDTGAMEAIVDTVIAANPGQIAEYRAGKVNLF